MRRDDHIGVVFPGIVTQVIVNVGDQVKEGQVLARLLPMNCTRL